MKKHFLSDEIYPTLTDDERGEYDKFTVAELTHKDSAPGSDRMPSSFYTHFWEKLQIQIGFVKGRNTASHLRLFDGLAKYHNNNNSNNNNNPPK